VTPSGLAAHWGQVRQWGSAVAALRPRSWADAEALAKLQGGVITYLLQQLAAAPDAPTAEFMWECGRCDPALPPQRQCLRRAVVSFWAVSVCHRCFGP
jgi:hypothetical protein